MSKITLYTANPSRGTNVRWMLTECGADYDNVVLDYRSEERRVGKEC